MFEKVIQSRQLVIWMAAPVYDSALVQLVIILLPEYRLTSIRLYVRFRILRSAISSGAVAGIVVAGAPLLL